MHTSIHEHKHSTYSSSSRLFQKLLVEHPEQRGGLTIRLKERPDRNSAQRPWWGWGGLVHKRSLQINRVRSLRALRLLGCHEIQ